MYNIKNLHHIPLDYTTYVRQNIHFIMRNDNRFIVLYCSDVFLYLEIIAREILN